MDQDPETLRAKSQELLIAFLDTDLDLGFTFARLSKSHLDSGASEASKRKALKVVETAKHFRNRIEDAQSSRRISDRIADLEQVIGTLAPNDTTEGGWESEGGHD